MSHLDFRRFEAMREELLTLRAEKAELQQQVEALTEQNTELVKAAKAVLRNRLNIGMLKKAIATAQQEGGLTLENNL